MRGRKKELPSAVLNGVEYKPGDCVLINPDAQAPAYIARINKFIQVGPLPHEVQLDVTWFYRPEEAVGGRKAFHGEAEVFASDHTDKSPLAAIIGRCTVHDIDKYELLLERTETDFFCRFKYIPSKKTFDPDAVPVYCICELPYNPDRPMVMCEFCEEWYHPQCLRLNQEVFQQEHFTCPSCAARPAKKQRASGSGAVPATASAAM